MTFRDDSRWCVSVVSCGFCPVISLWGLKVLKRSHHCVGSCITSWEGTWRSYLKKAVSYIMTINHEELNYFRTGSFLEGKGPWNKRVNKWQQRLNKKNNKNVAMSICWCPKWFKHQCLSRISQSIKICSFSVVFANHLWNTIYSLVSL